MKQLLLLVYTFLSVLTMQQAAAQTAAHVDKDFDRTMSRSVMESYLSRAITMQGLTDMRICVYSDAYGLPCDYINPDPTVKNPFDSTGLSNELAMLARLDARYIGRVAGLWNADFLAPSVIAQGKIVVDSINARYDKKKLIRPIIEAGIFEVVKGDVNKTEIPDYVANEFGYNKAIRRRFLSDLIHYVTPNPPMVGADSVPDMSRLHARMWFYYLATQYINAGYEAIHFGQISLMDKNDPGHKYWWEMLSKVRAYASLHARRHLVLCNAHASTDSISSFYFDQDYPTVYAPTTWGQPGPRKLLFDFNESALRIQEDVSKQWSPQGGGGVLSSSASNCTNPMYTRSPGGTPVLANTDASWANTTAMPFLAEIDNYENQPGVTPGAAAQRSCWPWGWDEIGWFSNQTNTYRNEWLKYAYYKVPSLDSNGYLEMPGMRSLTYHASNGPSSGTVTPHFNQQDMIQRLWNGEYDKDWKFGDVSTPAVSDKGTIPPNVRGSSVSYGDNVYYIGTDGRIYAYNKNGSGWGTTSPTWVANATGLPDQVATAQRLAAGDLVANPARKEIYYRGDDGQLYGFKVLDDSHFTYFKLSTADLRDGEKVKSDLILAENSLLCYISTSNRIYCYIYNNNEWQGNSPSWIAHGAPNNGTNTNIGQQVEAAGGLVANPSHSRLYYRGTDNAIHGFTIDGYWNYRYFDLPQTQNNDERVTGQLVCATDNRLYYIGRNSRVYGMVLNGSYGNDSNPSYGGFWGRMSPTYSAQLTPNGQHEQTLATGALAASPDGKLLAYIGLDNNLHGFRVLDDYNSEYFNFPTVAAVDRPTDCLRFKSNTELFYTSYHQDQTGSHQEYEYDSGTYVTVVDYALTSKLDLFTLTEQYVAAQNPAIPLIEGPQNSFYNASRIAASAPAPTAKQSQVLPNTNPALIVYPNPAASLLQIEINSNLMAAKRATLRNLLGQTIQQINLTQGAKSDVIVGSLPIQNLAAGLYMLVVTDGQGHSKMSKVTIQH